MSRHTDRVIITGASSGIGLDLARRLLATGSRLVINARNADRLAAVQRSLGERGNVVAIAGDVADPGTAERLSAAAQQHFGGVDLLVNSAGIFAPKPFLESTVEDLERFFATNVKGTFLVSRAVVPGMIAGGGGSIINLGTVLVDQAKVDVPVSAVMASKGAVHALTVSLAAELARHQIRVNTLAPGIIRTPLIGDAADSMASWHPLGRVGEVKDTSDAALFLANAEFVTGTLLCVDGGYSHGR